MSICERSVHRQLLVERGVADGALDLVERSHLDLAHALAADSELLREVLQGGRLIIQAPLGKDAPLARIEQLQRAVQQLLPFAELLALGQHGLLAVGLVDQPFLPLAFAVHADRRVQRMIWRGQAAVLRGGRAEDVAALGRCARLPPKIGHNSDIEVLFHTI